MSWFDVRGRRKRRSILTHLLYFRDRGILNIRPLNYFLIFSFRITICPIPITMNFRYLLDIQSETCTYKGCLENLFWSYLTRHALWLSYRCPSSIIKMLHLNFYYSIVVIVLNLLDFELSSVTSKLFWFFFVYILSYICGNSSKEVRNVQNFWCLSFSRFFITYFWCS